jgi:hypothetical protein
MKQSEILTKKQYKKEEQKQKQQRKRKAAAAAIALEKLITMPEVKDLIHDISLGKTSKENFGYGHRDYELFITENGLIKQWKEDEHVSGYFREDDYIAHHSGTEKVNMKKRGVLKEIAEFFNLDAKNLIALQKKIK